MSESPARKFYDRISHAYDAIADGGEHKARERGLEVLKIGPGEQVLEIGFGTGHSLVTFAEAVSDSGKVVGIDISAGMRDVSAKRLEKAGVQDRVELHVAPVPPFPDNLGEFDAINMSFTLELFELDVIPEVLAECRKLLKPGGRLGVVSMATVPEDDKESMLEKTYKWMHTHFPHIVDCQPIPLEKMLEDAGYSLKVAERTKIFTMPVAIAVAT